MNEALATGVAVLVLIGFAVMAYYAGDIAEFVEVERTRRDRARRRAARREDRP